jgi:hypothetical protein
VSATGTYKYDPRTQRVVKVSDAIPNVAWRESCVVPSGGYFSENLGVYFPNRRAKRAYLRDHGLTEVGTPRPTAKPFGSVPTPSVKEFVP